MRHQKLGRFIRKHWFGNSQRNGLKLDKNGPKLVLFKSFKNNHFCYNQNLFYNTVSSKRMLNKLWWWQNEFCSKASKTIIFVIIKIFFIIQLAVKKCWINYDDDKMSSVQKLQKQSFLLESKSFFIIQLAVNKCWINYDDDWIRTADL